MEDVLTGIGDGGGTVGVDEVMNSWSGGAWGFTKLRVTPVSLNAGNPPRWAYISEWRYLR